MPNNIPQNRDIVKENVFFILQLTPDGKRNVTNHSNKSDSIRNENNANVSTSTKPAVEEDFFEMLSRTQSKRMDDQRCSLKVIGHSQSQQSREPPIRKPLVQQNSLPVMPATSQQSTKENRTALLEMIADLQSERMDEQRAQLPQVPSPPQPNHNSHRHLMNNQATALNQRGMNAVGQPQPDDTFFEMLMRCQGSRLEEQRSVV